MEVNTVVNMIMNHSFLFGGVCLYGGAALYLRGIGLGKKYDANLVTLPKYTFSFHQGKITLPITSLLVVDAIESRKLATVTTACIKKNLPFLLVISFSQHAIEYRLGFKSDIDNCTNIEHLADLNLKSVKIPESTYILKSIPYHNLLSYYIASRSAAVIHAEARAKYGFQVSSDRSTSYLLMQNNKELLVGIPKDRIKELNI